MKRIAFALGCTLATALHAHAVEYTQVHTDKSSIQFTYKTGATAC